MIIVITIAIVIIAVVRLPPPLLPPSHRPALLFFADFEPERFDGHAIYASPAIII